MKNPSIKKRFRYKFTIKCVIYSTVDLEHFTESPRSKNLWRWKVVLRLDRCFLCSKFHSFTCRVFLRVSSFDCLSFRRSCSQKREKLNVVTLHEFSSLSRTACYYAGSLNDSGITLEECARYSGLKSWSANNTGSMRFGNRRPRPWTVVESKGVSTHGRGPFSSRPSAPRIQRKSGLC